MERTVIWFWCCCCLGFKITTNANRLGENHKRTLCISRVWSNCNAILFFLVFAILYKLNFICYVKEDQCLIYELIGIWRTCNHPRMLWECNACLTQVKVKTFFDAKPVFSSNNLHHILSIEIRQCQYISRCFFFFLFNQPYRCAPMSLALRIYLCIITLLYRVNSRWRLLSRNDYCTNMWCTHIIIYII